MEKHICDIIHVDDQQYMRDAIKEAFPEMTYQGAKSMNQFSRLLHSFSPQKLILVDGFFPSLNNPPYLGALQAAYRVCSNDVQKVLLTSTPEHLSHTPEELMEYFNCPIISKNDDYIVAIREILNPQ